MILSEPFRPLEQIDTTLDVIVRSEDTIDSRFISIDLENETKPGVEADGPTQCHFCDLGAWDRVSGLCWYHYNNQPDP